jgi:DNA-directed RNA polymerase subunit RPC12/RpoP
MTKYHKQQAEIRYNIDGYICQKCGKQLNMLGSGLAHRISKSKANIKKYGEKIINHNFNLVPSCLECNSSFLIDNKDRHIKNLLKLYKTYKDNMLIASKLITDLISL